MSKLKEIVNSFNPKIKKKHIHNYNRWWYKVKSVNETKSNLNKNLVY